MTIFITWNKSEDENFRQAYEALVNEVIQLKPLEHDDFYCVGSSVVTQEQANTLEAQFNTVQAFDVMPNEFNNNDEELT